MRKIIAIVAVLTSVMMIAACSKTEKNIPEGDPTVIDEIKLQTEENNPEQETEQVPDIIVEPVTEPAGKDNKPAELKGMAHNGWIPGSTYAVVYKDRHLEITETRSSSAAPSDPRPEPVTISCELDGSHPIDARIEAILTECFGPDGQLNQKYRIEQIGSAFGWIFNYAEAKMEGRSDEAGEPGDYWNEPDFNKDGKLTVAEESAYMAGHELDLPGYQSSGDIVESSYKEFAIKDPFSQHEKATISIFVDGTTISVSTTSDGSQRGGDLDGSHPADEKMLVLIEYMFDGNEKPKDRYSQEQLATAMMGIYKYLDKRMNDALDDTDPDVQPLTYAQSCLKSVAEALEKEVPAYE